MRLEVHYHSGWGLLSSWLRCSSPAPSQGTHGVAVGMEAEGMALTAGTVGEAMALTAGTAGEAMAPRWARLERPWLSRWARLERCRGHRRGRAILGPIRVAVWVSLWCIPMGIPIRIHPRSMSNPHSSYQSSRPRHHLSGTTVTIQRVIIPMSNSVPVAGERWPRAHNRWPETVEFPEGYPPATS